MCSPSGFIFMIIVAIFFNCLHYGVSGSKSSNNSGNGYNSNTNNQIKTLGAGAGQKPRRIDITRKRSVQLNGVEIDEHSLVHHLEDHEKEFIFGNAQKVPRVVKLVHLRHRTDVDVETATVRKPQFPQLPHRTKRAADTIEDAKKRQSDDPQRQDQNEPLDHEVSVQIQDNNHTVNLKLHQTPKLIDDAFIFLRRYANSTQFIEDSHKLALKYERCFYSNENAALDLCDDESVRGVFQHNSTDFIIQPLPTRFGNSTHLIIESEIFKPRVGDDISPSTELNDEKIQFEPDLEDFNDLSVMKLETEGDSDEEYERKVRNIEEETKNLDLNLSYKPRYQLPHHPHPHHHQHHHKNLKQRQRQHHHNQLFNQQTSSSSSSHHHHPHHHYHNHKSHTQPKHSKHSTSSAPSPAPPPHQRRRRRRYISTSGGQSYIPQELYIETAIFVDNDLVRHMSKNFPKDTENQLMRFVLAMINGVQLLYHHPTLGRRVNFVLKRLEILYKDPPDLGRSSDIDIYLSNFCMWQKGKNPPSDDDDLHFDHAVILTGLDLYVVGKNGKVISQVVGLAPVAGMCTPTSSCTINEGKHFESVFVVAHEIGHNLGMRHDTNENGCDPSFHIMSPTLGSGKITWSHCSRNSLNSFLETSQARCLFDRDQAKSNLNHSAEGLMPGQRFDADQQCMLKYGRDSVRARSQVKSDICRDLHCQRERHTWTSHPALEGTDCGENMWCRSGTCTSRPNLREANDIPKEPMGISKSTNDKSSFVENNKVGHLFHEYSHSKSSSWSDWSDAGQCDSGCLYGPSKRLREGSTGLKTYTRSCLDYHKRCLGRDKKYESCVAKQCYSVKITTIEDFASGICENVQKFDKELTGIGEQIIGDIEESCKIYCKTKNNGTRSRNWTFPDGTTCRSKRYDINAIAYCIGGRCEKFSCENSTSNHHKIDPIFCRPTQSAQATSTELESRRTNSYNIHSYNGVESGQENNYYNRPVNRIYGPTTVRSKYENEVAVRSFHGQSHEQSYKRKSDIYTPWNKYSHHLNDQYPQSPPQPQPQPPVSASLRAIPAPYESEWIVKSGCHSSCMAKSKGVQVVTSRRSGSNNIQLCTHSAKPCDHLLSATEYAENTCSRYKLKVRGLSGYGTQIAASVDDPDRSCRVGCQDEFIKYRFYLVNGKYGHFPLGTRCSNTEERYCVNGKCLEFGADNIPLQQSHISLALYRHRRSISAQNSTLSRSKRSYLYYTPVNITETITQDFINSIVNSIIKLERKQLLDELLPTDDHIEFNNPIHMSMDELNQK